jgi:hypothetical protein
MPKKHPQRLEAVCIVVKEVQFLGMLFALQTGCFSNQERNDGRLD